MADDIAKVIADTRVDATTLQEVVNGDDSTQVTTRLGGSYPTVKKAIKLMTQSGVGFTPFETKALMTASSIANGGYAIVTNDTTANSGLYLKKSGAWSKVTWDIDERQKTYTDVAANAALVSAKTYADGVGTAAVSQLKTYTDTKSGEALTKANEAADMADAVDLTIKSITSSETDRVGDAPELFSDVIKAEPDPIILGSQLYISQIPKIGKVLTVKNKAGYVATRKAVPVYSGHSYTLSASLLRVVNPTDPLNDTVEVGVEWLNQYKQSISHQVISSLTLDSANGITVIDEPIFPKATSAYVRAWFRIYGSDSETAIVKIAIDDVTVTATAISAINESAESTLAKAQIYANGANAKLYSLVDLTDAIANGADVGDYYYNNYLKDFYVITSTDEQSPAADKMIFRKSALFTYKNEIYTYGDENGFLRLTDNNSTKLLLLKSMTNLSDAIANGADVGDYYYHGNLKYLYKIASIDGSKPAILQNFEDGFVYLFNDVFYIYTGDKLEKTVEKDEGKDVEVAKLYSLIGLGDALANGAGVGDYYYSDVLEDVFEIVDTDAKRSIATSFERGALFTYDNAVYVQDKGSTELVLTDARRQLDIIQIKSMVDLSDALANGAQINDIYYHKDQKLLFRVFKSGGGMAGKHVPFEPDVMYLSNNVLYRYRDNTFREVVKSEDGELGRKQLVTPTPEENISAYVNGLKFADELTNHLTEITKPTDKFGHTPSFVFYDDVCYNALMINTRGTGETPPELTIRFSYFDLADPTAITHHDLCDIGDTVLGKTVTHNYDAAVFLLDDTVHLLWNSRFSGESYYTMLHQTFDTTTQQFSDVRVADFTVGNTTLQMTGDNINAAFAAELIDVPDFYAHIVLMTKISTRVENGQTYYYSSIGATSTFNIIVKTLDFINWEYVSHPDFPHKAQYEPTVYVYDDYAYYYCRQQQQTPYGFLTKYDLVRGTWDEPVYIPETQSRSQFFVSNNILYLMYAPKNRQHLAVIEIDRLFLDKSHVVQVAKVNAMYAYPEVEEYKGVLYTLFSDRKKDVYISTFTVASLRTGDINTKFRELFGI
ncbi:hypothetical protein [Psychrobacter sp. BI730]|uniref:hypothetical protein n=1 Tax=Psychrobacter sp. BI730 TaxID=2705463 RepID=UPI0015CB721D|nr:hypothetical protein [Psychrobacter sp. BI730]NYR09623.1 hypothetical protein [Psychrobacter sp. BI730]